MQPIIDLKNVDIFQKNILVLGKVNIEIYNGEFVYLTGKTGTGKSSLLQIMYADLPPKGDKVEVAGINLLSLKSKHIPTLRKKLGIVFQDYQLLSDRSVNDNLIFVMKATGWTDKGKIQERIDKVLHDVGLGTKGFKMPHQLSGGEQQRVCIARALINNPEIILADEPTGNLDPETSAEIMTLLQDISKQHNCTVLMATHDFYMIEKFPARTLHCSNGKVTGPECDPTTLSSEVTVSEEIIKEEIAPEVIATEDTAVGDSEITPAALEQEASSEESIH